MLRFNYKAKDQTGKLLKGKVEAMGMSQAAHLLRDKGLVVLDVSPERSFFLVNLFTSLSNRVNLTDVAVLTRQFSTMISAGLPITDALVIIKSQSKPALVPVVDQVLSDVEGGSSLGEALGKHQRVFSPVYIALIKAGETGGILDKILLRLADNMESQRDFQAKVKGALVYPTIVIVGMIAVMFIMMIFVVPKITGLFSEFNAELPTATKVLIGISHFFQNFWWLVIGLFVGLFFIIKALAVTEGGQKKLDRLKFKIPIVGKLQKQVILVEFARTLGLLVGAGIPILEGLKVVSGVVGNVIVAAAVKKVSEKVEKGFSLAYALAQEPDVFPQMLTQMLAVGEETGKVDEALLKVSDVFKQESEYSVRNLTTAIEPIIMIVLGVGVGFLVIAIIMPIYSITNQF